MLNLEMSRIKLNAKATLDVFDEVASIIVNKSLIDLHLVELNCEIGYCCDSRLGSPPLRTDEPKTCERWSSKLRVR